jgi:hypothetical protein
VAGWGLQTLQTTLTALGWYFILRAGYTRSQVLYRAVLASYATGVALNGFLPANLGTFERQLALVHDRPVLSLAIAAGAVLLNPRPRPRLPPPAARCRREGQAGWRDPREPAPVPRLGGAPVGRRVGGQAGVVAVFLSGYGIAVTFHTVISVAGGNSLANAVSVTPGGVGVNQATNVAALNSVTDAATATAYSLKVKAAERRAQRS